MRSVRLLLVQHPDLLCHVTSLESLTATYKRTNASAVRSALTKQRMNINNQAKSGSDIINI